MRLGGDSFVPAGDPNASGREIPAARAAAQVICSPRLAYRGVPPCAGRVAVIARVTACRYSLFSRATASLSQPECSGLSYCRRLSSATRQAAILISIASIVPVLSIISSPSIITCIGLFSIVRIYLDIGNYTDLFICTLVWFDLYCPL